MFLFRRGKKDGYPLGVIYKASMLSMLARRRKFTRQQYADILAPYRAECRVLTCYEASQDKETDSVLVIRHDVDHHHETAVRIAQWEHDQGIRATYCLLHTAWYYGELQNGRMVHTRELIETLQTLASLGHGVIFHNNIVVVALQHGIDPAWLLGTEIEFFRKHGVPMLGTSSHGDALCRQLEFRNYEIFRDRVWESRGGPRIVTHGKNSVELGSLVMEDFGLAYEAYDLPRDVYASESGGNWRTRLDTRGQSGLSRAELPGVRPGKIVGVLTHPIWWDFDDVQQVPMRRAG